RRNVLVYIVSVIYFSFLFYRYATHRALHFSLHDALPILRLSVLKDKNLLNISISDNGIGFDTRKRAKGIGLMNILSRAELHNGGDRKSTRLNSSHVKISYAVFCLKKKTITTTQRRDHID